MFLSELSPVLQNLLQQPIAFSSGFFSGILRLKLTEEPLSSWLEKQGYSSSNLNSSSRNSGGNNKPQSIEID